MWSIEKFLAENKITEAGDERVWRELHSRAALTSIASIKNILKQLKSANKPSVILVDDAMKHLDTAEMALRKLTGGM